jgi:two-component system, OmpR family, KDP operon response regulator KdpE
VDVKNLVLIIEDESTVRKFVNTALVQAGYAVVESDSAIEGLRIASEKSPALLLLDLGLPDMDGVEVIRRLRLYSKIPIIVLSARTQESDKIAAFEAGADDYVTKPVGNGELLARIRVALRHSQQAADAPPASLQVNVGELKINLADRVVWRGKEIITLTTPEYDLLALLVRNANRLLTDRFLTTQVWGDDSGRSHTQLRLTIAVLRRKLEQNPTIPRYILTEQGVGYRFIDQ